jgi:hypothetical protein
MLHKGELVLPADLLNAKRDAIRPAWGSDQAWINAIMSASGGLGLIKALVNVIGAAPTESGIAGLVRSKVPSAPAAGGTAAATKQYQRGGFIDRDQMAMLHAGETVLPGEGKESIEKQTKATDELTAQMKKLNDYLTLQVTTKMGGLGPGRGLGVGPGSVGFGGGAGGSYGGGAGNISPMGDLPGFGGGREQTRITGGARGGGGDGISDGGGDTDKPAPRGSDVGPGTGAAGSPQSGSGELGPAQALAVARQHLGEDEIRDQSKLSSFFSKAGLKVNPHTTAWCAAFTNASLAAAGVKGTGSLAAGSFTKWGRGVGEKEDIAAGDVGVVKGVSPRTGVEGTHVGILTGQTQMRGSKEYVELLAGNQGGVRGDRAVTTDWRLRSSLHLRRATERELGGVKPSGETPPSPDDAQRPAPVTGVDGTTPSLAGGGAEYLRRERAPLTQQLEQRPELKRHLAALATLEHAEDRTAVVESFYNRTALVNKERAKLHKPPLTLEQMIKPGSSGSFYGPERAGIVDAEVQKLARDPAAMKRALADIDAAASSNLIKGATDQGSGHDPNVNWQGGRTVRYGEVYNDWDYGGHEKARRFREEQQANVAAADRAARDRGEMDRQMAQKVEGTGKIDVNVNAPKGTSVNAEGKGLFKEVNVARNTQMDKTSSSGEGATMDIN